MVNDAAFSFHSVQSTHCFIFLMNAEEVFFLPPFESLSKETHSPPWRVNSSVFVRVPYTSGHCFFPTVQRSFWEADVAQ
jgi:hypothetical protein